MMLASIATVAIYGYFREKAEKRKDLLAFADEARDRFAEAAKQIHEERDREAEEREREAEERERRTRIDRLIDDLKDLYSNSKEQAEFLRVPLRELVDTNELRNQLQESGFNPTDDEFDYILSRLGLES
jgi:flagellar biosynthesis GTPase FlhF